MLKVVVRKSDHAVMPEDAPWRQDSPCHRPGVMEAAIAKRCGGTPASYEGFIIPDSDKERFMAAKRLRWDSYNKKVKAIPFSIQEEEERRLDQENTIVEHEMIRLQVDITTADKLDIAVPDKKTKLNKLKAQHDAIKDKKKDK